MKTRKKLIIGKTKKTYRIRRCCISSILSIILCMTIVSPSLLSLAEESEVVLESNTSEKEKELSKPDIEIIPSNIEIHNESLDKINESMLEDVNFSMITIETGSVSLTDETIEEDLIETEEILIEEIIEEEINPEPNTIVVQTLTKEIPTIIICYDDISITSMATPDMIETALKETWLEGYGELYYQLEQEYGVNAFLAIANAFQETGWDKTKSNLAMNHNNIYGLKNKSFDSIEDCIRYYFKLISKHYVSEGYISMAQINTKYCPPDSSWSKDIYTIANKLNTKVSLTQS